MSFVMNTRSVSETWREFRLALTGRTGSNSGPRCQRYAAASNFHIGNTLCGAETTAPGSSFVLAGRASRRHDSQLKRTQAWQS
jgi:hypothetical protein